MPRLTSVVSTCDIFGSRASQVSELNVVLVLAFLC